MGKAERFDQVGRNAPLEVVSPIPINGTGDASHVVHALMYTTFVAQADIEDVEIAGFPRVTKHLRVFGGAEGIRTPDLCSAIAALSQLSYSPEALAF